MPAATGDKREWLGYTRRVRLRRSDPGSPGIRRRRRGRGFQYLTPDGSPPDADTLARIRSLAVPPAWRDVWICPDERGHLQAVGTDAAGRRQYLYHPEWRRRRDLAKFDRMLRVAERLPSARRTVARHLADETPTRRRALACAFRLLDGGLLRVGGERYARDDGGVGLATLRCSAVTIDGPVVRLRFVGKAGVEQHVDVHDPALARAIEPLLHRPEGDPELLAYLTDDGEWADIRSADVNDYLREVVSAEASAKDFRTWHGTVVAARALADTPPPASARQRSAAAKRAAQAAADALGNTPTVARSSYIDPRVLEQHARGESLPPEVARRAGRRSEECVREMLT